MAESVKPKVYITRADVPEPALEILKAVCDVETRRCVREEHPREELLAHILGKDGLFCTVQDKIDSEVLDAAGPNLKVVATCSEGYDHIDVEECRKRNILVGHTPDVLTDAVAELAVGLLLMTTRRMLEAERQVESGEWASGLHSFLWMCGRGVYNSVVGIVGMGRIGIGILKRIKGFAAKRILYYDVRENPEANALGAEKADFEDLLRMSDHVVCCCVLAPSTRNMFSKNAFELMKPSSVFINVSRGGVVDHDALLEALNTGQIRGAGLDVTIPEPLPADHPLIKVQNCVVLPHIGASTIESKIEMAQLTVKNILAGLEGKPLPAPV